MPANTQPDYIALAMLAALVVTVVVMVIRKWRSDKATTETPVQETTVANTFTAPGSAGKIKLHDVAPKTAAMLMAIVAEKTGKPINELRFISIQEVKE